MKNITLCFALSVLLLSSVSLNGYRRLNAEDWTTSRGNANSTGFSPGKLVEDPQLLWEFKPEKSGFEGSAILAQGKVWIGDVEGKMFCLDLASGKEIWTSTQKYGFIVPAAYSNGHVVAGDFDGHVFCFSATDGTIQWEAEINQALAGGANFIGDMVLLTNEGGELFAFDLATGKQAWSYATGDQLRSAATLWNGFALLGGCDGRLHKIDVQTGTAAGEGLPLDGPSGSTPAVLDSVAVVPTQGGQVLAFDMERGEKLWAFSDSERSQEIRSSPAIASLTSSTADASQLVIITTRNRRVLGLDLKNGKMAWEAVVRKRCDASAVVCDGRVWVGGLDGMLYAFDLRTGEQRWSYQMSGQLIASPAISDGKIVVATDKGVVACFGKPD